MWYFWMTDFADFGFRPKYERFRELGDKQSDVNTVKKYYSKLTECNTESDCADSLWMPTKIAYQRFEIKCIMNRCLYKTKYVPKTFIVKKIKNTNYF